MASNTNTLKNSLNEASDWIELYNDGGRAVIIGNMYLTDDITNLSKWQIPLGTQIPAYGYVLIWADGMTADDELHASFSLSDKGEQLALYQSDAQTLVESVSFDFQSEDISYGRHPSNSDTWYYMTTPTPGQPNTGSGYFGLVADIEFTLSRGFYIHPFHVDIRCDTPDALILYTTDGSDPQNSETAQLYGNPLFIDKTTCVRAYATKPGWLATPVQTHTYLFLEDVITFSQEQALAAGYPNTWYSSYPGDYEMDPDVTQDPVYKDHMKDALLSIPTLSLATDKDNLFSKDYNPDTGGIYIYPGHGTTGGQDWERPVSAEFFDANSNGFHLNCGLRIQGGESRNPQKMPKHSFSLRFRDEYGPTKLNYPLFENWPVDSFDSIQLRGFFNNSWGHWTASQREKATCIRDQWMRDTLTAMGQIDAGQGFFVHLYINGMYWGLYNLEERPEEDHYAAYHGGNADTIDARNGNSTTNGTSQSWNQLRQAVTQQDWNTIQSLMDVDNFIDFMIAEYYAGNQDIKADGNWRSAGGGPDQRPWRFYAWDSERILENVNQTSLSSSDDPSGLFNTLRQIDEFQERFGDRVHKHLFNYGALTPEAANLRFQTRVNEIQEAIIAESARWGDYRRDMHSYSGGPYYLYTRDDFWYPECNRLIFDYFPQRTDKAIQVFRSMDLYPTLDAPTFLINEVYQHGGHIEANQTLSMTASAPSILYTLDGSDPRDGDISIPDVQIVSTTLIPENAAKKILVPTQDIGTTWQGGSEPYNDSAWTAGTPVIPNMPGAVGYERSSGYESFISYDLQNSLYGVNTSCYIRIPFTVDSSLLDTLSDLSLYVRCDDGCVIYLNGTEIGSINKPNPLTWNSECDNRSDDTAFALISVSQYINLIKPGQNILAVHGLNHGVTSSDFLFSVELVGIETITTEQQEQSPEPLNTFHYETPITLPYSTVVKARAYNGQWSALNEAVYSVGPVAQSLRITELMYHPAEPNTEFIELANYGTETINLNLVHFSTGIDFTFNVTDLAPGERVLVVENQTAFEAAYGTDLPVAGQYQGSLNNGGERIILQDAAGQDILNFKYKDWYKTTDGQGRSLEITPLFEPDPALWSDKSTWQASSVDGGTPGS